MDDLISREQAIDAIGEKSDEIYKTKQKGATYPHDDFFQGMAYAENVVKQLPSTQPEIIYCGDCKYKDDGIDEDGIPFLKCLHGRSYGGTRINDFCSWAERREE